MKGVSALDKQGRRGSGEQMGLQPGGRTTAHDAAQLATARQSARNGTGKLPLVVPSLHQVGAYCRARLPSKCNSTRALCGAPSA